MRPIKLRLRKNLGNSIYQKKLMERNNTSINLNMSVIDKTKTDEYKLKDLMDGKNMEYIKTEENEKKNDMPICSSLKNIFSQYPKHFPDKNKKLNKKNKDYKKKEKEESKQEEDSLNKIYEDNKIINNDKYNRYKNIENNEDNKQKYLNRTLTSFYENKGDIMYDKNNIANEKDNELDLNDNAQKHEENLIKKFQFNLSKKNKNKNEVNLNFNNDKIQNKSISDNIFLLDSNEIFEKEPDDINNYPCLPFPKIKNNCNPRGYEWILMPVKIAPNQLKQETGNCYMVSALEAMSKKPFLLPCIFKGHFSPKQDKFKLTFIQENGNTKYYTVLNNFPVKEKELIFMKPLENEAYAIIFEKVWAVVRGGYKKIDNGKSCEVFNEVLGTNSKYLHNDNMKVCDLDAKTYIQYKNQSNVSDKDIKDITDINKEIQKIKDSDAEMIEKINNIKDKDKKIESKKAFDEIREADKEGGIITVSLNMEGGGHCYSVLGTYSEKNMKTGKIQDFIILKNPWRGGDDLKEKINMAKIEEQTDGFDKIKEINRNHYETGIFYMPKEYFEGWFRSICICKPNYKENFPKVYDTLNLYKDIYEFYNIDADKTFYESFNGNEFIKTNIISKENLDVLLKIVHHIKSDFNFVYKNEKLSTIWLDKNKDLGHSNDNKKKDYYLIVKNNTLIVNFVKIKEKKDIKVTDFNDAEVYSIGIKIYKDKWYVIYPKVDKNPSKKKESKDLLVNPLKDDFDYMPIFDNDQKEFIKDSSINLIMKQLKDALGGILKSEGEITGFLKANPKSLIYGNIYKDLNSNQKSHIDIEDIEKNLNNKFNFIKRAETNSTKTGWVGLFNGINLFSNEKEDGHYHNCNYKETDTTNLFNLIGQKFKCKCYYKDNNIKIKECNKYFTFQKRVLFYNYTYRINDVPITCNPPYYDEYDLEKEKNNYASIK